MGGGKATAYWVAVGATLFKDAEGRNIFTQLPHLSLGEFKQLAPVHFFIPHLVLHSPRICKMENMNWEDVLPSAVIWSIDFITALDLLFLGSKLSH